eukprot:2844992-Rhodomonas_salina.2
MAMVVMRQSMPDPETVRPERVLIKWAERLKVRLREGGRERETSCVRGLGWEAEGEAEKAREREREREQEIEAGFMVLFREVRVVTSE